MKKPFTQTYNPLYFLASLGNGGLAVSFFMYLMFMVKHPDTPIPTFNHVSKIITGDNYLLAGLTVLAMLFILIFAFRHFVLLFQNVRAFADYKKTEQYEIMKNSNSEVTMMALPLTFAMSVNILFILGALFIPGLWGIVEYIFPFALIAFAIIGIYGLKLFSEYFYRLIVKGDFDYINNNNLSQLLSSFAFAMVAVGLAAPGAMSTTVATSVVGILGSIFFGTLSVLLLILKLVLGFKSIFRQGISGESAPSLWIVIPIMTLLGISSVRVGAGIFHNLLEMSPPPVLYFFILGTLVSIQAIMGLMGYAVMKKTNYFADYIRGEKNSVGSYSLICPGVAVFVLGMFFIHWGLVKTQILTQFSAIYFLLILPLVLVQIKTLLTLYRIDKKLLCTGNCTEIYREENCLN